jgi:hypothetical protein
VKTTANSELLKPFKSFIEFVDETNRAVFLTIYAIRSLDGLGRLVTVMERIKPTLDGSQAVEKAQKYEQMALEENRNGFPLTLSHAAVALWAALEVTIPTYVAVCLRAKPELLRGERFKKVRFPVSMLDATPDEQFQWIVQELQDQLKTDEKLGIGRFEGLLAAAGFEVPVESYLRRDLLELSQVRNLVVHRFGVVDEAFREKCPFRNDPIGSRLKISEADYDRYQRSVREFAAIIIEHGRWSSS